MKAKLGQIEVSRDNTLVGRFAAEDVGLLIVDTPRSIYTHGVVLELLKHGAMVVLCGSNHLPVGVLQPLVGHSLQARRQREQIQAGAPLRKRLWPQIVRAKIRAQAKHLQVIGSLESQAPEDMAKRVRSGDPENLEAQAARRYGSALFGPEFRRTREGPAPNPLLNYGYAIVRAATARAVCGAGLNPALGLHHTNQYNAFALADDLFEPLRPLVDRAVRAMHVRGLHMIDKDTKTQILKLLAEETLETRAGKGPLLVALERYAASLAACFAGEARKLEIPERR